MQRLAFLKILFLCSYQLLCQSSGVDLVTRFDAYQKSFPQTKFWLVLNQDKFAPSDTIFFKAYYLTDSLTSIQGKQLVHVDLVNMHGTHSYHSLFSVKDGIGTNQLILPDTLASGFYNLVAYTSWMKNFTNKFYFKKEIEVVHKNKIAKINNSFNYGIEGGVLIDGVAATLQVSSSRPGQEINLVDIKGSRIAVETTDKDGLAAMRLVPEFGNSYQITLQSTNEKKSLPEVRKSGSIIAIESTEMHADSVKIKILTSKNFSDQKLHLISTQKGKAKTYSTVEMSASETKWLLFPKSHFSNGVVCFSLLNNEGELLSSRSIYCPPKSPNVSVTTNKINYHTRERINLDVALLNTNGMPVDGEFSISVSQKKYLNNQPNSFVEDIYLNPKDFKIDKSRSNWINITDRQLVVEHEPIEWSNILFKESSRPAHQFNEPLQKRGVIYYSDSTTYLPDQTPIVFYLQVSQYRYQTSVSTNGQFVLNMLDFYGEDKPFCLAQVDNEEVKDLVIKWNEEACVSAPSSPHTQLPELDPYGLFSQDKNAINKAFNAFSNGIDRGLNKSISKKDITTADIEVDMEKYVTFNSMQEVIDEIIPSMSYQKKRKGNVVRVGLPTPLKEKTDPLYFIDGVATKNTDFFLSLKPSELRSIKVVYQPRKLVALGLLGKNGIVIVETKKGVGFDVKNESKYSIIGLSKAIEFPRPDVTKNQNVPNFKSTVYWSPSIKTASGKAHLEFDLTDDEGEMVVIVRGFTIDGDPFEHVHSFVVKPFAKQ